MTTWANWSGGVRCTPVEVARPTSEDEVAATVAAAGAAGLNVRPVGAGHSFSPLALTDGVVIDLAALDGVLAVDHEAGEATVGAGARIRDLGAPLLAEGLALHNQGDIDVQAIGGAVATGTHGTGLGVPNLSSAVVGARLVTAAAETVDCSATMHAELFEAARLSLGAVGVVTQLRLALVPAYRLEERTWVEPAADSLDRIDERTRATRHYEFFWVPGRDVTLNKSLAPTEAPVAAEPSREADGSRRRVDWSWRVFPSVRADRFEELEFAVPAEAGPDCFRELRQLLSTQHPEVAWPLEYRALGADDLWLSPAHGRESVTISVHQGVGLPFEDLFREAEAVFRGHGGRPHWGKRHAFDAADLDATYPAIDRFRAVRRAWDPEGRFLNEHLAALLS